MAIVQDDRNTNFFQTPKKLLFFKLNYRYCGDIHVCICFSSDGKELGSLVETEKSRQLAEEDSKSPSGVDSSMLDKVQDFDTSSSFAKATKRQKLIFLLLFLRELTAYTGSAVMAPLFPGEVSCDQAWDPSMD